MKNLLLVIFGFLVSAIIWILSSGGEHGIIAPSVELFIVSLMLIQTEKSA